jgi:CRISPR-associated protein Cst2
MKTDEINNYERNNDKAKVSKGLAITYLVHLSIASPSGGRSEIENLNVIKKIREGYLDYPYASAQAMKRSLRDTLKGLGYTISPIINSAPARTVGDPLKYIDDDLFGYMNAGSKKTGNSDIDKLNGIRKSVVSMTPLLSLSEFEDNIDFGSNMIGLRAGGNPMPYETEIHRGWYRISVYVELDRIGSGDGFIKGKKEVVKNIDVKNLPEVTEKYDFVEIKDGKCNLLKYEYDKLDKEIKYNRAKALVDSIRFLAPSGRNSNWLIDLTPKLMVAAYVKGAKTPFLEVNLLDQSQKDKDVINLKAIKEAEESFSDGIEDIVVGYRKDLIEEPVEQDNNIKPVSMKEAFSKIDGWLKLHFEPEDQKQNPSNRNENIDSVQE